ncbi:hypothetical protein HZC20_02550 [Candidatus Peregrinibacteria bacterium]|nr:hypothetical protein [Candidatus Peregrinibacteria bacterium]
MNFKSAVLYLESLKSYEDLRKFKYSEDFFDLKRLKNFLSCVDYEKLRYIHVAGSKGKGTTCRLVSDYLRAKNFKVGLFISPHIFSVTERISVNGVSISENAFGRYVAEVKRLVEKNGSYITYFEALFVIALMWFLEKKVDYVVLEVGLGGRLDATNIIRPIVSALTFVEKEHTDILGNSLTKILKEKLGIRKKGVPLVVGIQKPFVYRIIYEIVKGWSKVFFAGGVEFASSGYSKSLTENSLLAFCVLKILLKKVDVDVFLKIVGGFKMAGRFDVREITGKTIVFDIAHTPASIKNLDEALKRVFVGKKFIFLVSVMKDKNVKSMLKNILKNADKIVFTSSHSQRGFSGKELLKIAGGIFSYGDASYHEDPIMAFKSSLKSLKDDQILVVTGSNFLVSTILKFLVR